MKMYSIVNSHRGVFSLLVLVAILFAIMPGCDRQKRPEGLRTRIPGERNPTPEKQWKAWLALIDELNQAVLGVEESRRWLKEHGSNISVPAEIGFLETHVVAELPYLLQGVYITTDHQGNRRVSMKKNWKPVWPPAGFMNEADSLAWFRGEGYTVRKDDDGYTLTKAVKSKDGGINEQIKIGRGSTIVWANATIKTGWMGELSVKPH